MARFGRSAHLLLLGSLAGFATACGRTPGSAPIQTGVPEVRGAIPAGGLPEPWEHAKSLFYQAAGGDGAALDESRRLWRQLYQANPNDPTVAAYHGAATMLAAGAARWPFEKGALAREGAALLDAAVAANPQDLEVRFLRGMSNYRLPRFLGRGAAAAEDLTFVAARAREAAEAGTLPRPLAAAALYHFGLLQEKRGDRDAAVAAWRDATDVGPQTPAGRSAVARLDTATTR